GAGRGRLLDGPHQRRNGDRRRQSAQVEGTVARRRSGQAACAAHGLARLCLLCRGHPAEPVQQSVARAAGYGAAPAAPLACASPRQLEEPDIDAAGAEADFAVGEIIFPHAAETVVEAERLELWPGAQEPAAPFAQ